ncbi:MAG: nucleoside kinase [Pseudomonadota bacterium]
MTAPVIHVNGWPGCGKRTIARALTERIKGRLLDNHLILDPAIALFARGTSEQKALREAIRGLLYEAVLTLPAEVPIVLTDALSEDDHDLVAPAIDLAERRGAPFRPILLDLDGPDNARRLTASDRRGTGKRMDPAVLYKIRAEERLLHLPDAVEIDATALSAEAAADRIVSSLALDPEDNVARP